MSITIRACTIADLESLLTLDRLWESEDISYEFTHASLQELSAEFERFGEYFLVAENDGRVVGYTNASIRTNRRLKAFAAGEPYLQIENLYVMAEYRDLHVGGDLIEKLLEIAERNGIRRFMVGTVTRDMGRILKFYERYGFQPWHVELFKE